MFVVVATACARGDDLDPVASFGGVYDPAEPDGDAFVDPPDLGAGSSGFDDADDTGTSDGSERGSSESSASTGDDALPSGCCAPRDQPLCSDIHVFACVCHVDPSCCVHGWDDTCVAEVTALDCGQC